MTDAYNQEKVDFTYRRAAGEAAWNIQADMIYAMADRDGKKNRTFFTGELSTGTLQELSSLFAQAPIAYDHSEVDEGYVYTDTMTEEQIATYSRQNLFYRPVDAETAFQRIMEEVYPRIVHETGCNWRVVGTVTMAATPTAEIAQFAWHTDGFPNAFRKIIFYLGAPSEKNGTTELRLPSGDHKVEGPAGTWIFLDVNEVPHRGIAPTTDTRPTLTVTLACDLEPGLDFINSGMNSNFPVMPQSASLTRYLEWHDQHVAKALHWYRRTQAVQRSNKDGTASNLNIGGGPDFLHTGWVNLEAAFTGRNPVPFHLSPTRPFPLENDSIDRAYWSHNIEHLWPDTIANVLHELRRSMRPGGKLVLKLPDYDRVLAHWSRNDPSMMYDPRSWAFEGINWTWPTYGIEDNLTYRSATVFIQWNNPIYGTSVEHYTGAIKRDPRAYHGPARLPLTEIETMFRSLPPSRIASEMREYVLATEKDPIFQHVSAWGRDEIVAQLAEYGFDDFEFDAEKISAEEADIPGVTGNYHISLFVRAKFKK
jgi:SAM-dependent methyltransferase